ncbi:MAG: hypothetical protein AAF604_07115 [Acidobacteriota bacterium]
MLVRRTFLVILAVCLLATASSAQQQRPSRISPAPDEGLPVGDALRLHAFTLEHKLASEALELVKPLLSPRGSVEIQPGGNTLVVRDSLAALGQIIPRLRNFDHPAMPLEVEVVVLRAFTKTRPEGTKQREVPAALEGRLRQLLRYETFQLVARSRLQTFEGEEVTYDLGRGFSVVFHLGTVLGNQRLKLRDFKVEKTADGKPLIHTNLNLFLGKTTILGLAATETSESALMVAVTGRMRTPLAPLEKE